MKALTFLFQFLIQVKTRNSLVRSLQSRYMLEDNAFYKFSKFDTRSIHPDQRLTQDINLWSDNWAQVISRSIDVPIQIIYYNYFAIRNIGWIGLTNFLAFLIQWFTVLIFKANIHLLASMLSLSLLHSSLLAHWLNASSTNKPSKAGSEEVSPQPLHLQRKLHFMVRPTERRKC